MKSIVRWFPWAAEVGPATLRADGLAGLLGALLVLPQGIAFAALAGLPASYGLATAVLPCVLAAVFGSSRYVMSGPTNALSLAMLAMLAPLAAAGSTDYVQLALVVTVLVGLLQLGIGLLRLGTLAHFISPVALQGFTGGAAVLIALHALPDLLGVALARGQGAGAMLLALAQHLGQVQPSAVAVAAVTLASALLVRRLAPRWPHMLLALAAGTAAGVALAPWSAAATLGSVPAAWPSWQWPAFDGQRLPDLVGVAAALTIVALAQSFAIAKTVAQRSGERVDANREFFGQGVSNTVGGLFSCYVSCGSLNRSLPNLEAGARTPLASVFSAVWLLALVALSGPLLAHIPMPSIAALLVLVAWSLLDLPRWRALASASRVEFGIGAATLVATVVVPMQFAILFGSVLSLGAYLWRTSRPAMRTMGFDTMDVGRPFVVVDDNPAALPECPQLKLLRMEGAVFFGATQHVAERLHALRNTPGAPKHLLVMAKSMNFLDLAGTELWRDELRARRRMGGDLYFHRPRPPVLEIWERTGFIDELGRDHIFADKRTALATIVPRLDPAVCERCTVRLFHESPARR